MKPLIRTLAKMTASISLAATLTACSGQGPSPATGFKSAARGIAMLVLTPVQITAGVLEGVASLPYYAATGLKDLNEGLVKAQAAITLEDTYGSAYQQDFRQVPDNGDTGQVFRRMKTISKKFQSVLSQYGVNNADEYLLTSIDTANKKGYTLFAVVHRSKKNIRVYDKYKGNQMREFAIEDRLFYEPFATDVDGSQLDEIIDWAAVPTHSYTSQKQQAVMITLAANKVISGQRRNDYWQAERQWINGGFLNVYNQQQSGVKRALGI